MAGENPESRLQIELSQEFHEMNTDEDYLSNHCSCSLTLFKAFYLFKMFIKCLVKWFGLTNLLGMVDYCYNWTDDLLLFCVCNLATL